MNAVYYQLVPEKICQQFDDLSKKFFGIPGYTDGNLMEVISIIAFHVRKNSGWTPLNATYIRRYVSQGDEYLHILEGNDVVLKRGTPKKNVSCYQYKFAPSFESNYITIPLTDQKLIRRIKKAQTYIHEQNRRKNYSPQNRYLSCLTINPEAFQYIETNLSGDSNQYNMWKASATRIVNEDIRYNFDNTSHRFHSNITNMPKELRKFLRIQGSELVSVDIKNCQPYLSTLILTNPAKAAPYARDKELRSLLRSLKVDQTEDVKKYIRLVVDGQLYEFLGREYQGRRIYTDLDLEQLRKAVKKQVYRILFAENKLPSNEINRRCREIFTELFPEVHRVFCKIRGNNPYRWGRFKNYKRFAILLQTIESQLVLENILMRLYKEHKSIVALTIHDSIVTKMKTDQIEEVQHVMQEELQAFVGLNPTLKLD